MEQYAQAVIVSGTGADIRIDALYTAGIGRSGFRAVENGRIARAIVEHVYNRSKTLEIRAYEVVGVASTIDGSSPVWCRD